MIARLTRLQPPWCNLFSLVFAFSFWQSFNPRGGQKETVIEGSATLRMGLSAWFGFSARLRNDVFTGHRRKPITCPTGCHRFDRYTTKLPRSTHHHHRRHRRRRRRRRRPPARMTLVTPTPPWTMEKLLVDRWIRQTDFEAEIIYGLD